MPLWLWFIVVLVCVLFVRSLTLVPRLLRRHNVRAVLPQVVLEKRDVPPVPGDMHSKGTRYQLLLEDEDGRQVWTWCDAETFATAEPGAQYKDGRLVASA